MEEGFKVKVVGRKCWVHSRIYELTYGSVRERKGNQTGREKTPKSRLRSNDIIEQKVPPASGACDERNRLRDASGSPVSRRQHWVQAAAAPWHRHLRTRVTCSRAIKWVMIGQRLIAPVADSAWKPLSRDIKQPVHPFRERAHAHTLSLITDELTVCSRAQEPHLAGFPLDVCAQHSARQY